MDFELGEDQRAIQDLAAGFATKEMAPHAARWDAENYFPREVVKKAAGLGFGGLYAAAEHGGSELDLDPELEAAATAELRRFYEGEDEAR